MKNKLIIVVTAIFTLCSCNSDNTIYAYVVSKTVSKNNQISKWRPVMRVAYRIVGDKVISEVANVIDEYNDCIILNKRNWECQYSDGTGKNKFGFKNGKFWKEPGWDNNIKHISRWEYNFIRCKWYQHDFGMTKGTYLCLKTYI